MFNNENERASSRLEAARRALSPELLAEGKRRMLQTLDDAASGIQGVPMLTLFIAEYRKHVENDTEPKRVSDELLTAVTAASREELADVISRITNLATTFDAFLHTLSIIRAANERRGGL